jgi:hypothetical protein
MRIIDNTDADDGGAQLFLLQHGSHSSLQQVSIDRLCRLPTDDVDFPGHVLLLC